MTANHPITPPPELIEQWLQGHTTNYDLARQAARWGADQELEACLRLVEIEVCDGAYELSRYIRAARRPKPPSLKERALQAWVAVEAGTDDQAAMAVIRRALEALDD